MAKATMVRYLAAGLVVAALGAAASSAQAAVPVVSYSFQGTLAADQAGAPALTAIDPQGTNGFQTATVGGVSRSVYAWQGQADSASHQAGLTLDTTGLLSSYQSYTVVLNVEFIEPAQAGGGWRRIVDTQARQSDNGFYVSPENRLQVVQSTETSSPALTSGSTLFTTRGFHTVWLAVQGLGAGQQRAQAWLDGTLELTASTNRFGLDDADNPNHLLTFFADNLAAGAQQEYANGRIASLALYDGALTPQAVPEPQAALMLSAGLAVLALWRRRGSVVRNVTAWT